MIFINFHFFSKISISSIKISIFPFKNFHFFPSKISIFFLQKFSFFSFKNFHFFPPKIFIFFSKKFHFSIIWSKNHLFQKKYLRSLHFFFQRSSFFFVKNFRKKIVNCFFKNVKENVNFLSKFFLLNFSLNSLFKIRII